MHAFLLPQTAQGTPTPAHKGSGTAAPEGTDAQGITTEGTAEPIAFAAVFEADALPELETAEVGVPEAEQNAEAPPDDAKTAPLPDEAPQFTEEAVDLPLVIPTKAPAQGTVKQSDPQTSELRAGGGQIALADDPAAAPPSSEGDVDRPILAKPPRAATPAATAAQSSTLPEPPTLATKSVTQPDTASAEPQVTKASRANPSGGVALPSAQPVPVPLSVAPKVEEPANRRAFQTAIEAAALTTLQPTTPPARTAPLQVVQPGVLAAAASAKTSAQQGELTEKSSPLSIDSFALGRSEGTNGPMSPTAIAPTARPDLAAHVARQIADVAHHLPGRPVEITLSPEELGRVRLSVSTHENGIVLNVMAERPETADLLKRHIGQLGQQFASLGYESIAFTFSGGGDADPSGSNDGGADTGDALPDAPETAPIEITLSTGATTGLDLRL